MRILFALGNTEETGGWANYARNLEREFSSRGMVVETHAYTPGVRAFPSGLRHLLYGLRLIIPATRADVVFAIDTWSTGLPAVLVTLMVRRPLVVRVGGDFLWEQYVERTGEPVKLSEFYNTERTLSIKERIVHLGTRFLTRHAHIAFNTAWLRDLWSEPYSLRHEQVAVIENVFPARQKGIPPVKKNFVAAGRPIRLKNELLMREVFTDLQAVYPDIELDTRPLPSEEHQRRVASCYAVVLASVSDVAPNSVIDAVVHGKPFIAPKDTGLSDRLENTGLFIDTLDREAFADAIRTLLDPEAYERIAERVRAVTYVREWKTVADEFESLFRRVAT
ncbi:MAG: hypothetical protein AAB582_02815 [Patescibacteria group bacterium]